MVSTIKDLDGYVKNLRRFAEKDDKTWSLFNPSIGMDPSGKLFAAFRSSNYVILPHGELHVGTYGPIRNNVWVSELTDEFEIENLRKLDFSAAGISVVRGVEDPKLLWRDGQWMFMGVMLERHTPKARNCLFYTDKKYTKVKNIEVLPGYDKDRPEKNWMTANKKPKNFDYVYDGTAVVVGDRIVRKLAESQGLYKLRGNGNLIEKDDGTYLGIMHILEIRSSQVFSPTTFGMMDNVQKTYDHFLVRFDEDGWIVELSEPFNFDFNGIEFANGFIERGDEYVISFGKQDVSSHLAVAPQKKLLKTMKRVK